MPESCGWAQCVGQSRDWIAARIPHAGRMCLLDRVLQADERMLLCSASNHHDPSHPLRAAGRLGSACGVEYAAQAMALHGAVMVQMQGSDRPAAGYLVSVRALNLHVSRLDAVAGALHVRVERLAAGGANCAYAFALNDQSGTPLLDGRAHVILEAPQA